MRLRQGPLHTVATRSGRHPLGLGANNNSGQRGERDRPPSAVTPTAGRRGELLGFALRLVVTATIEQEDQRRDEKRSMRSSRDAVGNWSVPPYQQAIILDKTKPTGSRW